MSIPLDRLYHYLESLSNDDIIIYRWSPHGSKKLADLSVLNPEMISEDYLDRLLEINMICHDQEPLDYHLYSVDVCFAEAVKIAENRKQISPSVPWCYSDEFLKKMAQSHLRTMVHPILNLHDSILLCHSEKNSKQLDLYEQNGFIGVYYWSHALIAKDWYRYAEHDLQLIPDTSSIEQDFLIYGRAWSGTREYRLKMIELLANNNLLEHCKTKFNPIDNGKHYTDHNFSNKSLKVSRSDLESYLPTNTASSDASADYVSADYATTGLEVILETLFDDDRQHLTEKSLRPIACGRPFMLAATPGSLAYLRGYGFKTFDGLIDESYDTITDPLLRLQAIVNEMSRIAALPADAKQLLWAELYKIADYNKTRFFSDQFHTDIINEYTANLSKGVRECQQTINGTWWWLSRDPAIVGTAPSVTDRVRQVNTWLENYASDLSRTPSQPSPGSCSV